MYQWWFFYYEIKLNFFVIIRLRLSAIYLQSSNWVRHIPRTLQLNILELVFKLCFLVDRLRMLPLKNAVDRTIKTHSMSKVWVIAVKFFEANSGHIEWRMYGTPELIYTILRWIYESLLECSSHGVDTSIQSEFESYVHSLHYRHKLAKKISAQVGTELFKLKRSLRITVGLGIVTRPFPKMVNTAVTKHL